MLLAPLLLAGLLAPAAFAAVPGFEQDPVPSRPAPITPPGWLPELAMTPVSAAEARELFAHLRDMREMNWLWLAEGCYARAYVMAHELETKFGIVSIRAEAVPPRGRKLKVMTVDTGGFLDWTYHTVPLILVFNGEVPELWAIDPLFAREPMPFAAWQAKVEKNSPKGVKYGLYNRFVYQDSKKRDGWNDDSLRHARQVLADPARYLRGGGFTP